MRLGRRERPHCLIGAQQRVDPRIIQRAGCQIDAPVVHTDGDVEEPFVVAGEIEVEKATEPRFIRRRMREQYVVAEQVAMARTCGQRRVIVGGEECLLMREFGGQQIALDRKSVV